MTLFEWVSEYVKQFYLFSEKILRINKIASSLQIVADIFNLAFLEPSETSKRQNQEVLKYIIFKSIGADRTQYFEIKMFFKLFIVKIQFKVAN